MMRRSSWPSRMRSFDGLFGKRINKRVTIGLHDHDKRLEEARIGSPIGPSIENRDGGAETEVTLHCH